VGGLQFTRGKVTTTQQLRDFQRKNKSNIYQLETAKENLKVEFLELGNCEEEISIGTC
jgi:hypothetical protein